MGMWGDCGSESGKGDMGGNGDKWPIVRSIFSTSVIWVDKRDLLESTLFHKV